MERLNTGGGLDTPASGRLLALRVYRGVCCGSEAVAVV